MAYSQARGFMFCNLCGTMLSLVSPKIAECSLCRSKTSAKGIQFIYYHFCLSSSLAALLKLLSLSIRYCGTRNWLHTHC